MKTKKSAGAAFVALVALAGASSARPAAAQTSGHVVAEGCTAVTVDARPSGAGEPSCPQPRAVASAKAAKSVWYGWQTLTVDGAALLMASAAASRASDESASTIGLASLAVYAAGAPVVHAANGSPAKMGISLGMRVGAPVLLGAGGYYACGGGDSSDWGPALCGVVGIVLGMTGAVAVDAAVLARKKVEADEARAEPSTTGLRVTPTASPTRGGAAVGLVGRF